MNVNAVLAALIEREERAILGDAAPVVFTVHEAGEVRADGSQACRCGFVILHAAPPCADRTLWGLPFGRRIVQGPVCTYLVTADRPLTRDEVPCS